MAESPFDNCGSVRGSANNSTIAPAESLEIGRRVHIGNRDDARIVAKRIDEHLPTFLYFGDICHVSHRATSGRIGQEHFLVWRAEDIGALSHEMHAAEHDIIRLRTRGGQLSELKGVASIIGILDNFVTLVMMSHDHKSLSQTSPGFSDTPI